MHLHSLQRNQGYGEAVRQGMKRCLASGGDHMACLHADGQYPPEQLDEFVEQMHSRRIDVLQGLRYKGGSALAGGMPVYKYVAGKCVTWFENKVFGLRMTDDYSGFLVYSGRALRTVPI